jgi:hypothetical protein
MSWSDKRRGHLKHGVSRRPRRHIMNVIVRPTFGLILNAADAFKPASRDRGLFG